MKQNKIGIFDSGIGGINVLKELINAKPNNNYIYYGDSIHLPYGNKTKEELFAYTTKIIDFFIKQDIQVIIIACGTVCSTIYDDLLTVYPQIEFINIIKPTIDFINNIKYQNIALIGTTNTINSKIFTKNANINILSISTPEFVPIIEEIQEDKYDYYIDYYLKDIKNIDAIILGCTHYPVLSSKIEKYLNVPTIDMGKILAKEIPEYGNQNVTLYFSLINDSIKNNIKNILGDYPINRKEL